MFLNRLMPMLQSIECQICPRFLIVAKTYMWHGLQKYKAWDAPKHRENEIREYNWLPFPHVIEFDRRNPYKWSAIKGRINWIAINANSNVLSCHVICPERGSH